MKKINPDDFNESKMDTCLQVFHFVGLCKGLDRPQAVDDVLGFAEVNLIQCISDLVLHVLHEAT